MDAWLAGHCPWPASWTSALQWRTAWQRRTPTASSIAILSPRTFFWANGQVKVLDFGLARFASHDPLGATAEYLTQAGQVMGTVGYMSPEQAKGHIPDGRGDIFSLGCVLYEMVTGRPAFPGSSAAEVLAAVLRDQPALMEASDTTIPFELRQLVSRCLAKKPADRFQAAHDVAIALRKLVAGDVSARATASGLPSRPCVAVLPFQNFSANRLETDYIVDGMTEVLIAELARNRALRVVSRTTMMQFKDCRIPIPKIAREVEADVLVEGSVLLAGPSLRITAQLIRAESDEHMWAESYHLAARDVLSVQSEVARAIAQEVKKSLFDEMYRSESRHVLATLIRLLGDFDLAEEALQEAFAAAAEQWPRDGIPANPRAWLVSTGRLKGMDSVRRRARLDASLQGVAPSRGSRRRQRVARRRGDRRRSPSAHLHVLPPGLAAEYAGRADVARGLRVDDRRDRQGLANNAVDGGPAHRARKGEDSRRRHSLQRPLGGRPAGTPGQRAAGDLSGVQRRLFRVVRRLADAPRLEWRSDSLGALDRRTAA